MRVEKFENIDRSSNPSVRIQKARGLIALCRDRLIREGVADKRKRKIIEAKGLTVREGGD